MTQANRPKAPSPGRVEREKLRTVLRMLPEDGSKRRWTDLERQARSMKPKIMSIRTLKKNLDKLESAGLVTRHIDTSTRPPGVYYSRGTIRISYNVVGPGGARCYDPKRVMENEFEIISKEISELKKKSPEDAAQKLNGIVTFNISEAFRYTLMLLKRELCEKGDVEHFSRWMDVVVSPRLELLLKLCIRHFDVAEQSIKSLNEYADKIRDEE
jgi:hypothetical protein